MTVLYFDPNHSLQIILGTIISMIPLAIYIYFDKKDDGAWLGWSFSTIINGIRELRNNEKRNM